MTARDDYLKYAEECCRLAQRAAGAGQRARLLAMAQAWRELGDKIQNLPTNTSGKRAGAGAIRNDDSSSNSS
jgi:hypothetical protein